MVRPLNKSLYDKVKREAKLKFKRWPSAYGSMWLSKEYTRRGGRYDETTSSKKSKSSKTSKKQSDDGVQRWLREEWIQVMPYLTDGTVVKCGAKKDAVKACRPRRRISAETPVTISELIKLHGKKRVVALARQKMRDMDGRLYWKRGVFYPSAPVRAP